MDKRILITALALLGATPALADDAAVRAAIARLLPDRSAATDARIAPSALAGVSEVAIGTQVFYVTENGRYVLGGPLIDSVDGRNLTEARVAASRQDILDAASGLRTFRYPAADARHRVTVVTDIDCPYCRRLHNDLPAYREAGIDVTYVMLPRAGKNSNSYRKTVSAACASDPERAITAAMNGAATDATQCDHPIDEHMALARRLGVTSTPTIVLDDGRIVLGQKRPADLLELIEAGD